MCIVNVRIKNGCYWTSVWYECQSKQQENKTAYCKQHWQDQKLDGGKSTKDEQCQDWVYSHRNSEQP